MCDARNERAVAELRRRKGRDAKPFAVMVANVASAERIGAFERGERALLRSIGAAHRRRATSRGELAPSLAPGLSRIGVDAALCAGASLAVPRGGGPSDGRAWRDAPQDFALVATSANPSGEPLIDRR